MFKFWSIAIEPALRAIAARDVVEIGSRDGATTRLMADYCRKAGGRCHTIEPEPRYVVAELEHEFKGHLTVHQTISLDALFEIDRADAVLIDGDHNWYTVFHELLAIEEHVKSSTGDLPLLVFHDVGFPYGRRDMYYAPERIPAEFRQPFATRGIVRGQSELVAGAGLNPHLCNALHESGPRNGVLTAVEDFVARSARRLELVLLPVHFGLGLLATRELVDTRPELAALFARFDSNEGLKTLLGFAEGLLVDCETSMQELVRENEWLQRREPSEASSTE